MISQARAADQRYYGIASAIVTDVNDPEQEGRVQVRFPWFDPHMTSEWCRVAQLYAGAGNKGSLFVPDLEDEVIVAFVHGDMREPVVIGCVYNGADKPPTYRDATRDEKMIRTRAGHELLFVDTDGKERVRVQTQGGHVVDCDDANKKVAVKTSGGHAMTLDDGGMKVTIATSDGLSIEMSSGKVTLTGSASIELAAPNVNITTGASMKVPLGDLLVAAFNTHTHICSSPGSPCAPPTVPMPPSVLSSKVKVS